MARNLSEDDDSLFRLDTFRAWQCQHFEDEGDSEDDPDVTMPVCVKVDVRRLACDFFSTNPLFSYLRFNSFMLFFVALVHYLLRNWL